MKTTINWKWYQQQNNMPIMKFALGELTNIAAGPKWKLIGKVQAAWYYQGPNHVDVLILFSTYQLIVYMKLLIDSANV
jgi:hypothetical protein